MDHFLPIAKMHARHAGDNLKKIKKENLDPILREDTFPETHRIPNKLLRAS